MTNDHEHIDFENEIEPYTPSDASRWATRISLLGYLFTAVLMASDVVADISADSTPGHVFLEAFIFVFSLGGVAWFWRQWRREQAQARMVQVALAAAQQQSRRWHAEAERWRDEAREALHGLGNAIQDQFQRWELSPAEAEVALLLLKGLSLKDIADVRAVSERTVRQQARAVYKKAELAGRAELSAFFLEDLLSPSQPPLSGEASTAPAEVVHQLGA